MSGPGMTRMTDVLMDIVRYDSGSGTWAGKIFQAKGQIMGLKNGLKKEPVLMSDQ